MKADELTSELKIFHSALRILRDREFVNQTVPSTCCEVLESLTAKTNVLESLRYLIISLLRHHLFLNILFERNLPESLRQYVDHHQVIPSLWPELLESTGRGPQTIRAMHSKLVRRPLSKGRSKNAARVIFQYLNIFSERELIEELIDTGYHSTDWKDHFNLADTLSSLLQQIEPSGKRGIIRVASKKKIRDDEESNNLLHCYLFCDYHYSISR